VTGRRNAWRVKRVTISRAHGSSSAALRGRQLKMRSRLGVLLKPVVVNGAVDLEPLNLQRLSSPSMMPTSPPPGMNGWSTASDSASVRATNVAATWCGPADTVARNRSKRPLSSGDRRRLVHVDVREVLGTADRVSSTPACRRPR
jgi:hypothetical protein